MICTHRGQPHVQPHTSCNDAEGDRDCVPAELASCQLLDDLLVGLQLRQSTPHTTAIRHAQKVISTGEIEPLLVLNLPHKASSPWAVADMPVLAAEGPPFFRLRVTSFPSLRVASFPSSGNVKAEMPELAECAVRTVKTQCATFCLNCCGAITQTGQLRLRVDFHRALGWVGPVGLDGSFIFCCTPLDGSWMGRL